MFARFFVDRPVFATVLSLVIVIIGGVALQSLPIAQYPEVVPPTVNVSATYPGASAKVVADTVAAPIEQEVNGVENMLYMLSKSTNDGQMNLDVTFRVGTNLDFAGAHPEPGLDRRGEVAGGGEAPGRHGEEEVADDPPLRESPLSRRALRPALPQQLRHHPGEGRARPAAGGG